MYHDVDNRMFCTGVDECATQAYGLQDTNSEMQPIEEKDANNDDVNEGKAF